MIRGGAAGAGFLPAVGLASLSAGFAVSVRLAEAVGPSLLVPANGWRLQAASLWLVVLGAGALSALAAGRLLGRLSRSAAAAAPLAELPGRLLPGLLLASAFALGLAARLVSLDAAPWALWQDDLLLLPKTLALASGAPGSTGAVRPVEDASGAVVGTVGALYLEGHRLLLSLTGPTVLGVRLPAALAGAASILTAAALGAAVLPPGGGALAGAVVAGLRWSLVLSRWGWNMVVLAPLSDLASLLAVSALRRRSLARGVAAGVVAGLSAHVYLAGWIVGAAVVLLLLWPGECPPAGEAPESPAPRGRRDLRLAAAAGLGFAAAVLPLLLFRGAGSVPYFTRGERHNVAVEMRSQRSVRPLFRSAAEAVSLPWLLADPEPRNDLPRRARLPLLYGAAVAAALFRAVARPREPLSALLLAHGAAAAAAYAAWGELLQPNSARYAYLVGPAAVAAAAGILWGLALVPAGARRAAALVAVGAVAILGVSAANELPRWAGARGTFDSLSGPATLRGRAAVRWGRLGAVRFDPPSPGDSMSEVVRACSLLPAEGLDGLAAIAERRRFALRIAPPGAGPREGERTVERLVDAWGRDRGTVFARRRPGRTEGSGS